MLRAVFQHFLKSNTIYAKEHTPCVIIIDELDKIAGLDDDFSNEDSPNVNKLLLQEIDNIPSDVPILIVATCNDKRIIGSALLRRGRFDRHVFIGLPDENTRKKIFEYYFSKVSLKCSVDLDYAAKITNRMSGAGIECLVNESVIIAINHEKEEINIDDVRYAIDKMSFDGKADKPFADDDLNHRLAIHEAGHAVVAMILAPYGLYGASIIPQGISGGHIVFVGKDLFRTSVEDKENEIVISLAGRAAEREVLKKIYLGSDDDINRAHNKAFEIVSITAAYGYDYVSDSMCGGYDDMRISEQKRYELDKKLAEMLTKAEEKAAEIIKNNRALYDKIVEALFEKKSLNREELMKIKEENESVSGDN